MTDFPAVLIGGPPHSGKSALTYNLTQVLRRRGVDHYVLRAYPDGEGDWSNEAPLEQVRLIRVKGQGTPAWIDRMCRDIAQRHLPLIVDVGGLPTLDQERLFDYCTHAILLSRDDSNRAEWIERLERHHLMLIADLHSELTSVDHINTLEPVVTGTIAQLEQHAVKVGAVFDVLLDRLSDLFCFDEQVVRHAHLAQAPAELVIDLDRLSRTLGVPADGKRVTWKPEHLPRVLDYLPVATPLALYGRGPNWLYAAISCLVRPASFYQFDVRLGWVAPRLLPIGVPLPQMPLQFRMESLVDAIHLEGRCPGSYLEYDALADCVAPSVPAGIGIVLSGKLPHWLYTTLALTYREAAWVAIYQPQLKGAVVVHSVEPSYPLGHCYHMD